METEFVYVRCRREEMFQYFLRGMETSPSFSFTTTFICFNTSLEVWKHQLAGEISTVVTKFQYFLRGMETLTTQRRDRNFRRRFNTSLEVWKRPDGNVIFEDRDGFNTSLEVWKLPVVFCNSRNRKSFNTSLEVWKLSHLPILTNLF